MAWTQKRTFAVGGLLAGVLVLYVLGSEKQRTGSGTGTEPAANTAQCRVTVTADVLNIRAAPDLAAKVVDKFNRGKEINADRTVQNGFRKIGENRWISTQFIKPMTDCG